MSARVEDPFWNYSNQGLSLTDKYKRGPFIIKSGPLGAFATHELSSVIHNLITSYLSFGTLRDFLKSKTSPRELVGSFISHFSSDIVVVEIANRQTQEPLGGCMIHPGKLSKPIRQLIGVENTNLPTLWALNFNPDQNLIWDMPERQIVNYSRFYRLPDQKLPDDFSHQIFSMECLSSMAIAVAGLDITHSVLDTNADVAKTLTRYYGGQLVDTIPTPTTQVLKTVHRLHYQNSLPQIVVFDFAKQLEIAKQVSASLGEKIPL